MTRGEKSLIASLRAKGLTLKEIGKRMGYHPRTIARYTPTTRYKTPKRCRHIVQRFSSTVEEFDRWDNPLRSKMNTPGVYIFSLASNGRCLYVGKSINSMTSRVTTHTRFNSYESRRCEGIYGFPLTNALDKLRKFNAQVNISFIPYPKERLRELEKKLICEKAPALNRRIPACEKLGYGKKPRGFRFHRVREPSPAEEALWSAIGKVIA